MFNIIKGRKIWLTFSSLLVLTSIILIAFFRLNFGMDFTGGILVQLEFKERRPEITEITNLTSSLGLNVSSIQPVEDEDIMLRLKSMGSEEHVKFLNELKGSFGSVEEKRFESIGSTIGNELKRKALIAIAIVLFCIVLYIAYAFRKVSEEISSWKLGVCAIIALIHDVLITIGVFSVLGYFLKVEIDSLFIVALLTVLGYSVNDTIVVFDRTRDNLVKLSDLDFEEVVNRSINQTLTRSVITSLGTLLTLFCIYLFGGETVKYFSLVLIIGIIIGTYSSIFVASPLLVFWQKLEHK